MSDDDRLNAQTLIAEARRLLSAGGYHLSADPEEILGFPSERTLVAEDRYGVVGVIVFDTWADLSADWVQAEAALVDAISHHFTRAEPKAWEGYLVLLTPADVGPDAQAEASRIRQDTARVRKLVATGGDLGTLKDVEQELLPLMPLSLEPQGVEEQDSVLRVLPGLLSGQGIDRGAVDAVLSAFQRREPLIERLHEELLGQ